MMNSLMHMVKSSVSASYIIDLKHIINSLKAYSVFLKHALFVLGYKLVINYISLVPPAAFWIYSMQTS